MNGFHNDNSTNCKIRFTGEYFVPGKSPQRVEIDHIRRYEFAAQFVRNKNVLDIACGTGYGSKLLAEAGALSVVGVDISIELVDYAKSNYQLKNLSFVKGDICRFENKSKFDIIICFETIEHIQNYKAALKNLYGLLKKHGILFISSPNRLITSPYAKTIFDKPENPFHVREFTLKELQSELLSAGFLVRDENIFGQRQRFYFRNKFIRAIQTRLFRPEERSDSRVKPNKKMSRYLIFVVTKQ